MKMALPMPAYKRMATDTILLQASPGCYPQTPTETGPATTLHSTFKRKVVRYGDKVIKSGTDVRAAEAENMRFIAAHTTIPVPAVLDVEVAGDVRTITMEHVAGERLDKVWNRLPQAQKHDVARQLRGMLEQLRGLRGDYVGTLGRGAAVDGRRFDLEGGPFESEALFNRFLVSDVLASTPQIMRDMALRALRADHAVHFSHCDFVPGNILVRDGQVVALLDWEDAGYYPEYWDFVKTFKASGQRATWHNYVEEIFPQCYETEYIHDSFLGSILRH